LRDRLLFALLLDCGVRIGEALGTRHEDMMIAEQQLAVTARDNDNRARVKAGRCRIIPASTGLFRLYAGYLACEYGVLDSDYVFVNLRAAPYGRPLAYPAVYDLVVRLRKITGIAFSPHLFRHAYATWQFTQRRRDGKRERAPRPCLDHHHDRHLRPPDRRRRPQDAGGRGLVHRPGGTAVTAIEISQGDRARWRRRAAELGRILAAHPDLPCISWTAGPAGPAVAGHVSGLAPAGQVRQVFQAWRLALELEEYRDQEMSGGTAWLHAAVRRHQVRVRLTATVFPGHDGRTDGLA
jgi:hypothetical protein